MKQKLLMVSAVGLVAFSSMSVYGGSFLPSFEAGLPRMGVAVMEPKLHDLPQCIITDLLCAGPDGSFPTIWLDPGMIAVTALDYGSSLTFAKRTIDASDAIKKLKKALGDSEDKKGGSSGGGGTSGDTSLATAYTTDMIMTQIEVKQNPDKVFDNTRQAIQDYLFETTAPDIKGSCDLDDRSCAIQRQNEWLLASVTLASATADKVLAQTSKSKTEDKLNESTSDDKSKQKSKTKSAGKTTLTAHFKALAANFNKQTSPMGLYNRMADIVLDTHRHINDANALLGRDLEMTGLRVINETGAVLLDGSETEE